MIAKARESRLERDSPADTNIGHNRWRMTFIARPPLVR